MERLSVQVNKRKLKNDIISMICVIVIICGLCVLAVLEEKIILFFGLIYGLFLYIQIYLCHRFKSGFVKLLPMIVLLALGGFLVCKALLTTGYESLGYSITALIAGIIFVTCLFVWGLCLIVGYRKKN